MTSDLLAMMGIFIVGMSALSLFALVLGAVMLSSARQEVAPKDRNESPPALRLHIEAGENGALIAGECGGDRFAAEVRPGTTVTVGTRVIGERQHE